MPIRIGGGLSGGLAHDAEEHSDNLKGFEKLPQANGGVKAKFTSHMTGNNEEGIVGGIDNKGIKQGNADGDFRKVKFHNGHKNEGGTHRQY